MILVDIYLMIISCNLWNKGVKFYLFWENFSVLVIVEFGFRKKVWCLYLGREMCICFVLVNYKFLFNFK